MDLIGELLIHGLRSQRLRLVEVTRIRPSFRRRVSAVKRLSRTHLAFTADRVLNRLCYYPKYLRKLKARFDVFHIVDHSYAHLVKALLPAKTVVTCHDIDAFRCLSEPRVERRSFAFRAMTRRILKGIQSANAVVCVSRWTRDEVLRCKLLPSERLKVVPTAVAPEFRPDGDSASDSAADELLGPKVTQPILLHVGSTISRKRIDVLLNVFAGLHRELPTARLVRVGAQFNQEQMALLSRLSIEDSVVQLPALPRDVLAAVYRKARLLLLPSEREGFGLPVLEAMACGTPVLASDLPVLREIGGDAVEYCAVGDISWWISRARFLLVSHEGDSSAARRQRGIDRASHLDCATYAENILNVYSTILS
jgi:glycosyltransferase involved in cell wall biosynthesis